MAKEVKSAGLRAVSSSTEAAPTAQEIEQARQLLEEIASMIDGVGEMSRSLIEAAGLQAACGEQLICKVVDQIGWMADLAAHKLHGQVQRGWEAEHWMLWPRYRELEALASQSQAPAGDGQ